MFCCLLSVYSFICTITVNIVWNSHNFPSFESLLCFLFSLNYRKRGGKSVWKLPSSFSYKLLSLKENSGFLARIAVTVWQIILLQNNTTENVPYSHYFDIQFSTLCPISYFGGLAQLSFVSNSWKLNRLRQPSHLGTHQVLKKQLCKAAGGTVMSLLMDLVF